MPKNKILKNRYIDEEAKLSTHMACHGPFPSLASFPDPLSLPEILIIEKSEYIKIYSVKGPLLDR